MERTIRYSKKREAILAAIRGTSCHPSAEWIYQQLKPRHPDLSLGTVYRNLNRLREKGQAVSLGAVGGRERFDGDTSPHAHLVCQQCGAVLDVPARMPEEAELARIAQETGCVAQTASLTFRGLCPQCAGNAPKNQEEAHGE